MKEMLYDWNHHRKTIYTKPDKMIEIHDETLRDGIQSPSVSIPNLNQKIEIVRCMDKVTAINSVNLGFPAANDRIKFGILECVKRVINDNLNMRIVLAARTLKNDIIPIIDISQKTGIELEAMIFVGSSYIRQYVEDWNIDKLEELTKSAISFAVKNNIKATFVTEDTTRSSPSILKKLYLTAIENGAYRIVISDTVGHATPDGVFSLVRYIRNFINHYYKDDIKIDFHGHMDRGLGVWNSITALVAGANQIHACALGIGERSGNTPMEQLLINLKLLGWIHDDLSELYNYSLMVAKYLHFSIPPNYPIIGKDAFSTASGTHAAAILKSLKKRFELTDQLYSSISPKIVGRETLVKIGPMSGKSNIICWLIANELPTNDELIEYILNYAKNSDHVLEDKEIKKTIKNLRKLQISNER